MAQPTITSIIRQWKKNENQRFHVIGTNFDKAAVVTLQDDRADWSAPVVESVSADATGLIFVSQPVTIHRKIIRSSGSLTITITNPDTKFIKQDVDGTYES